MSDEDKFRVVDSERGNERPCETRAEAEEKRENLISLGASPDQLEIIPPGESTGTEATDDDVADMPTTDTEPMEATYDETQLPEKPPVDEDPIVWMPNEFTDTIEGTTVINRKGYEVMAHHYEISTWSDCVVGPEETDFTFCRVKATASKPDGTTYTAHGSAHTDRGDDSFLLLEMADTRARKRAIAQATGVGMLAAEELMNQP